LRLSLSGEKKRKKVKEEKGEHRFPLTPRERKGKKNILFPLRRGKGGREKSVEKRGKKVSPTFHSARLTKRKGKRKGVPKERGGAALCSTGKEGIKGGKERKLEAQPRGAIFFLLINFARKREGGRKKGERRKGKKRDRDNGAHFNSFYFLTVKGEKVGGGGRWKREEENHESEGRF